VHILILKSVGNRNEALHRMQTHALFRGLGELGIASSLVLLDDKAADIPPSTHVFVD